MLLCFEALKHVFLNLKQRPLLTTQGGQLDYYVLEFIKKAIEWF